MRNPDILYSTRSGIPYQLGRSFHIGKCLTYEARADDGHRCWIKQVASNDEAAIAQLRYEAIILSKLNHPGVIRLLDRGRSRSSFFLVLDPVQGRSLLHLLEHATLPIPQVVAIATHIAELLVYLHSQGIICRVLAPAKLYIDHLGRPTLVDLNAAWDEVSPIRSIEFLEDAPYLSPEQAVGTRATRHSDIYTFGVLLFELLTGQPPFRSNNWGDFVLHHLLTPPPDVQTLRPDTPPELVVMISRCLAKSTLKRYSDATALLSALRNLGSAEYEFAGLEPSYATERE